MSFYCLADVNECATDGACDENAACFNTPGSYICVCNDGYNGNGYEACVCEYTFLVFIHPSKFSVISVLPLSM